MNKLFCTVLAATLLAFSGCFGCFTKKQGQTHDPSIDNVYTNSNSYSSSTFNEEDYVWEYFIFSTNQIQRVK